MKTKSIVFKLTVIVLCVLLFSVAATVTTSVIISGNAVGEQAMESVGRGTENEMNQIDSWLVGRLAVVNTVANVLSGRTDFSDDAVRPVLQIVATQNASHIDAFIGFPNDWAVMASGVDVNWLQNDLGWYATKTAWYQGAMEDIYNPAVTDPYIDTSTGDLIITVSRAIIQNGEVIGVAGIDLSLSVLVDMVLDVNLDGTGYAMLVGSDDSIYVHGSMEGTAGIYSPDMRSGSFVDFTTVDGGIFSDLMDDMDAGDGVFIYPDAAGVEKYYTSYHIPTSDWHLLTVVPANVVSGMTTDLLAVVVPIAIGIMAIAAIIVVVILRSTVATPLAKISDAADELAIGNIELENLDNETTPTKNEVILLERAFSRMIDSFKKQAYVLARIAEGDYTAKVEIRSEKDVINSAIELVLEGTLNALGQVATAGVSVMESSKDIAEGANKLALGASDQAATVQELSATMSVIADKTKDNAGMAGRAATLANTIKNNAEEGSQQMGEMMKAVQEINQASQDIGKVIKTIDDIAFQTNILALNAAVEAARAGQHGKGFAVVAEEVRNLAAKSAEAASETGSMISNSMEKAELGTRIANETSASLAKIVEGINESTKIVTDIASSSEEQTISIDQINSAIEQVAQVVQQNSHTAEQSAEASKAMSAQSAILEDLIKQFQLGKERKTQKGLPPASRR